MTNLSLILPNGKQRFEDDNGNALVGGEVYFYVEDTSTPKDTWQDLDMTTLNTNPVILDSRGEAVIYGAGNYRQVLKDADGNTIWDQPTQGYQTPAATPIHVNPIEHTIDGNGSTPTTGISGDVFVPFACTITQWTLQSTSSGSITFDVWMKDYADNDPPTAGDSITASAPPTMTSVQSDQSSILSGWVTDVPANSWIRFNIDSVSALTRCTLTLTISRP